MNESPTLMELRRRIAGLNGAPLPLSDEDIDGLRPEEFDVLIQDHGSWVLCELPPREVAFNDWLRLADPEVFEEVWPPGEDQLVSLAQIPRFRKQEHGLLICELERSPNWFFTARHVKPEGLRRMQEIFARAEKGRPLSIAETLLLEIMSSPLDLWHFCYKYGLALDRAKAKVLELVQLDMLVHLPDREDADRYLEDE